MSHKTQHYKYLSYVRPAETIRMGSTDAANLTDDAFMRLMFNLAETGNTSASLLLLLHVVPRVSAGADVGISALRRWTRLCEAVNDVLPLRRCWLIIPAPVALHTPAQLGYIRFSCFDSSSTFLSKDVCAWRFQFRQNKPTIRMPAADEAGDCCLLTRLCVYIVTLLKKPNTWHVSYKQQKPTLSHLKLIISPTAFRLLNDNTAYGSVPAGLPALLQASPI